MGSQTALPARYFLHDLVTGGTPHNGSWHLTIHPGLFPSTCIWHHMSTQETQTVHMRNTEGPPSILEKNRVTQPTLFPSGGPISLFLLIVKLFDRVLGVSLKHICQFLTLLPWRRFMSLPCEIGWASEYFDQGAKVTDVTCPRAELHSLR